MQPLTDPKWTGRPMVTPALAASRRQGESSTGDGAVRSLHNAEHKPTSIQSKTGAPSHEAMRGSGRADRQEDEPTEAQISGYQTLALQR